MQTADQRLKQVTPKVKRPRSTCRTWIARSRFPFFQSFNIGANLQREMEHMLAEMRPEVGFNFPPLNVHLQPADKLFPLKVGDELFIDGADAEPNQKMQFRFKVALSDRQLSHNLLSKRLIS